MFALKAKWWPMFDMISSMQGDGMTYYHHHVHIILDDVQRNHFQRIYIGTLLLVLLLLIYMHFKFLLNLARKSHEIS